MEGTGMLDRYAAAAGRALGEVAASVAAGGVLHVFGAGHSQLLALGCRERGLRVVALTNLEQAKATAPRHPSGARLHELADVVIDNRCPAGDAALELASGTRVRPLTTVLGAAVVAALCARVAELLLEQGHRPLVLASQNLDGRPAVQDNAELVRPYLDRERGRPRGPADLHGEHR